MNQIKFVGFGCSTNHLSTARAPRSGAKCADLHSMRQEKFFTTNKPAARFKGMQQGCLLSAPQAFGLSTELWGVTRTSPLTYSSSS
jgi:hypothetical protein